MTISISMGYFSPNKEGGMEPTQKHRQSPNISDGHTPLSIQTYKIVTAT